MYLSGSGSCLFGRCLLLTLCHVAVNCKSNLKSFFKYINNKKEIQSGIGPFIISINDIDLGLSNFINKFADDTKIGNAALMEQDRRSRQEDLHKLSDWCEKWEMSFNTNKCQILQIG